MTSAPAPDLDGPPAGTYTLTRRVYVDGDHPDGAWQTV